MEKGLWDKVAGGDVRIMTIDMQCSTMSGRLCLSCDRDYGF